MTLSTPRYLLALASLAFAVRLAAVLLMRDPHAPPAGIRSDDPVQYHHLAVSLAEGSGYLDEGRPTSFRAPGYPFLVAAVYASFGVQPAAVYVVHCLLGALSCVFTYLLAREFFPEAQARLAGLFAAVYLGHVYFATVYFSENPFVPALGLAVLLVVRYLKGGPAWGLGVAGLALGYCALTRPMALLFLGFFPPLLAWHDWRRGRLPLRSWALFAVPFVAVLAPWAYRNHQVHGRFVLIATNGGSTFYGGNNDKVVSEPRHFGYWVSTTDLPHRDLIDAQPDEVSHDKMEWRLGVDWLRANPGKIPRLLLFKLLRLWWLPDFDAGRFYYALRIVGYFPFLALMALGLARVLVRRDGWTLPWLLVHLTLLATVVTALVFSGLSRFRDANLPVLMLYCVAALGTRAAYPTDKAAGAAPAAAPPAPGRGGSARA